MYQISTGRFSLHNQQLQNITLYLSKLVLMSYQTHGVQHQINKITRLEHKNDIKVRILHRLLSNIPWKKHPRCRQICHPNMPTTSKSNLLPHIWSHSSIWLRICQLQSHQIERMRRRWRLHSRNRWKIWIPLSSWCIIYESRCIYDNDK